MVMRDMRNCVASHLEKYKNSTLTAKVSATIRLPVRLAQLVGTELTRESLNLSYL
jgi:hypothetical protein